LYRAVHLRSPRQKHHWANLCCLTPEQISVCIEFDVIANGKHHCFTISQGCNVVVMERFGSSSVSRLKWQILHMYSASNNACKHPVFAGLNAAACKHPVFAGLNAAHNSLHIMYNTMNPLQCATQMNNR